MDTWIGGRVPAHGGVETLGQSATASWHLGFRLVRSTR